MTDHTPIPWMRSGVRQYLGDEDCIKVGPDGFWIAFLPIGRRPQEQAGAIADANFIVRAVNAHGALVAAVEALLVEGGTGVQKINARVDGHAALALAKRQP